MEVLPSAGYATAFPDHFHFTKSLWYHLFQEVFSHEPALTAADDSIWYGTCFPQAQLWDLLGYLLLRECTETCTRLRIPPQARLVWPPFLALLLSYCQDMALHFRVSMVASSGQGSTMVGGMVFEARLPGFESLLVNSVTLGNSLHFFISLCLGMLVIIIPTSQDWGEDLISSSILNSAWHLVSDIVNLSYY